MGRSFMFLDDNTIISEDQEYVKEFKIIEKDGVDEISKGKIIPFEGKNTEKSLIGVTKEGFVIAYS